MEFPLLLLVIRDMQLARQQFKKPGQLVQEVTEDQLQKYPAMPRPRNGGTKLLPRRSRHE